MPTREEVSNSQSILSCPFRPIDTKIFNYALSAIPGALKQPYLVESELFFAKFSFGPTGTLAQCAAFSGYCFKILQ